MNKRKISVKAVIRTRRNESWFVFRWKHPVTRRWCEEQTEIPGIESKRRLAERAAAQKQEELNSQKEAASWGDFKAKYLAEHLSGLAERSRKAWGTARTHLERLVNPQMLGDVDTDAMNHFAAELRKEKYPETTIATYQRTIMAALGWAKNPAKLISQVPDVDRPKRANGVTKHMRGRPVTGEEFDRMLVAAKKERPNDYKRIRRILRGLWLGGLRLGEAHALSWNRSAPVAVIIDGGFPAFRFYAEGQKRHADELLPMTPDFAEYLLAIPDDRRRGKVFKTGLSADTVGDIISAIGRAAKIRTADNGQKFATAHDLRRSFGTRWATKVEPIELQRLMRHKSLETTLKYYVRINSDDLAKKLWAAHGKTQTGGQTGGQPQKTGLPKSRKQSS